MLGRIHGKMQLVTKNSVENVTLAAVDIDIIETVEMVTQVIKCGIGHTQNFCGISHNWQWKWSQKKLWPFPLPIMAYSTVFKSRRIQREIVLVELVTLF